MYRQGLNPNISSGLAASRLYTMVYANQIAHQMEEETKKKALMRAIVASNIRVAMLGKDSPSHEAIKGSKQLEIQEEICEPLNANLKENVDDSDLDDVGMLNIDDLVLNDEGMLAVIRPLLTAFN
ncbi:hypothetical protein CFP56_029867 [Quercus suber]|uniref:Uncharacterized protein n=1 Tax=Quercus suber TaxID=58331 RepID=A0AAW0JQ64_QUESU